MNSEMRNIDARLRKLENQMGISDEGAPKKERLNLAIPTEIKNYLYAAAYRESNEKHTVSVTEYICRLVTADMEKHKEVKA